MLRNISNEVVILKFDGIEKSLNPKECLDVREFGVNDEPFKDYGTQVNFLENRFIDKFKGKIEKFIPEAVTIPIEEVKVAQISGNKARIGKKTRGRPKKR